MTQQKAPESTETRIALIGDLTRPDVVHGISQIAPLLRECCEPVTLDHHDLTQLNAESFDLVMNFGGDGSLLACVRAMGDHQVPVVGVNFGKVGFLASFELPDVLVRLDDILDWLNNSSILPQSLTVMHSMMLKIAVQRDSGSEVEWYLALNDAVVSRGSLSRIIELDVQIDGQELSHYRADGLIVSTPAGSTAHALSAGGPVLEPDMQALVIAPICPHSLAVRPLVVSGQRTISITVSHSDGDLGVTFDGQDFVELKPGSVLQVSANRDQAILLSPRTPDFYQRLRNKLFWGAGFKQSR